MTSTNWAGNLTYSAARLHHPTTVAEVQTLVSSSPRIRALGSRHSFNGIADTDGDQVSVAALPAVVDIDTAQKTVTVSAGARYGDFVEQLDTAGFALANLASLPHISVAGAVATGTHGSGDRNGSLATAVAGIEFVGADGTLHTASRGDTDFDGMVVSLGLIGVVTSITLDIEPRFEVAQTVWENLPWANVETHLDEITSAAYSVSQFTAWGDAGISQAWVKSRTDAPAPVGGNSFFGATPAAHQLHPLPDIEGTNTTVQHGVPGPWWDRLPHFKLEFTPSNGEELQTEYLVPRSSAIEAIAALRELAPRFVDHLFITELRTVAADTLWLSPSHDEDCVAFHFTWMQHIPEVMAILPAIDDALAPFRARPHWGKVFTSDRDRLAAAYPRAAEFVRLAERFDPSGKFRNDTVNDWLFD